MSWGFGVAAVVGAAAVAGGDDDCGWAPGAGGGGLAAVIAVPSTRTGIASLRSVTYFSFAGSKKENENGAMVCFFSLGESTISNVLVPLIPTSSSCLNFEDGGYLCQPCSSCSTGASIRSKFPRPVIVDVTVIGS